jgi:hypothetical protein
MVLLRVAYRFHIEEAASRIGGQNETDERGRNAMAHSNGCGINPELRRHGRANRSFFPSRTVPCCLAWRYSSDRLVALLTRPEYIEQAWRRIGDLQSVRVLLTDADGSVVLGATLADHLALDVAVPHVIQPDLIERETAR